MNGCDIVKKQKIVFITANSVCERRVIDTSKLIDYFLQNECRIVKEPDSADYIVLVTCAFLEIREKEGLDLIEKLSKCKGELIVVGCLPEISKTKLKRVFRGKTISTKNLHRIDRLFPDFKIRYAKISDIPDMTVSSVSNLITKTKQRNYFDNYKKTNGKSSPLKIIKNFYPNKLIKIKDTIKNRLRKLKGERNDVYVWQISSGCLGNCSFCAIPKATGKLRSKPLNVCEAEYKHLLGRGYRRFMIVAEEVGTYGLDINSSFSELVDSLSAIDYKFNVEWELQHLDPPRIVQYRSCLIKEIQKGKIAKIYCTLQSGSERILSLMNRPCDIKKLIATTNLFKKANPSLVLQIGIMIGFPGETTGEFQESLNIVEQMKADTVALFPYSDREGTLVSRMKNKITDDEKKMRINMAIRFLTSKNMNWFLDKDYVYQA